MLFQLVLTKFFKSELFLCLPKVDHVIKSCKEPVWQREVVSCQDFILSSVATFWVMSLVEIYPGRASYQPKQIGVHNYL